MKYLFASFITLMLFVLVSTGQEHPSDQEHPEDPSTKLSVQAITMDNIADAIRKYVAGETAKGGGTFVYIDDQTGKTLNLKLKKVHDDKLAALGDNTYFACTDFNAANGKVYDLDIFMSGEDAANLKTVEIAIHKEDGVERYIWMELDGIWHKVAVEKDPE